MSGNLAAQLFGGSAKDTKLVDRGTPFENGRYVVEVKQAQAKQTREKGPAWIVEFKVVEVISSESADVKPGMTRVWYQNMQGKSGDVGKGEIYKFLFAVNGISRKGLTDADISKLMGAFEELLVAGDYSTLNGKKLIVETVTRNGKGDKADKVYTNLQFSPLEG